MSGGKGPRSVIYDPDGHDPLIGQRASSASLPFVIAHDQTPIPVTGSVSVTGLTFSGSIAFPAVQIVSASDWIPTITGSVVVSNTVQVTGSIRLTEPITGSVGVTGPVAVSNFPAVQVISGSNWIPTVTGSVGLSGPVAVSNFPATQQVTGSVGLSGPITGSVGLSGPITGSVGITAPVTVVQGTASPISAPWPVIIVSGSDAAGTITHPFFVTGSVGISTTVTVNTVEAVAVNRVFAEYALSASISNMNVNGAVTNRVFTVPASTKNINVTQIRFVMSDNSTPIGADKFAAGAALTNGVKLEVLANGTTSSLGTLKINEHFLESNGGNLLDQTGAADVIGATWTVNQLLASGSTEQIRVTIQDDLTSVQYFTCRVFGTKDI